MVTIRVKLHMGDCEQGSAMDATSVNPAMRAYIDDCRRRGYRPSAIEAARHAQRHRLGLDAFVSVLPSLRVGSGAVSPASVELREFILALGSGEPIGRVLEIGDDGAFYTSRMLSGGARVSLATRLAEFGEALAILANPDRFTVQLPDALNTADAYDLIVAHPPVYNKPSGNDDGFGSELAPKLAALLSDRGRLVWISGRRILSRQARTPAILAESDLGLGASLDLPSGWCESASLEGVALVYTRPLPNKKLIGWMREPGSGRAFAECLLRGPTKKTPPDSVWIDRQDEGSFRDLEGRRLVDKLMPKGRFPRVALAELLLSDEWEKADKPAKLDGVGAAFIYVPEYPGSKVTVDLTEQSVTPKAVYRFTIDPGRVDARFLARLLNSPFGRALRQQVSDGTIARIYPRLLMRQMLPIPDLPTQLRIVRTHEDAELLEAVLADQLKALETDWRGLDDVSQDLASMKAVVDADRRVEDWWCDLPYPVATIYRRYRVLVDPKERLEAILQFFEVFAVYLAAIGASHLRAIRSDADAVLEALLHPKGVAGIDRADFGFWIGLAQACGKELKRTLGDRDRRMATVDYAGASLVSIAEGLIDLGEVAATLDGPRVVRNSWKGHGGHMKKSDAERLVVELEGAIRTLYARCNPMLRRMKLVRIGRCENRGDVTAYEAEVLRGSDPTFEQTSISVARRVDFGSLAFWHSEQNDLVAEAPFFLLGAPANPAERTVYVYSRKEGQGFRWVSYQEASEQIIVTDSHVMRGIGRLGA